MIVLNRKLSVHVQTSHLNIKRTSHAEFAAINPTAAPDVNSCNVFILKARLRHKDDLIISITLAKALSRLEGSSAALISVRTTGYGKEDIIIIRLLSEYYYNMNLPKL